jgi:sodium transport system permease protein
MSAAGIVFVKEMRESLRDRRVLLNTFVLGPLLGPLLFVLIVRLSIGRELARAEKPLAVAVAGVEYAPNLIAGLVQLGLEVRPAPADAEAAVRAQRADLVLRVPAAFAQQWRAGQPAQVEIIYDSSRTTSQASVARLRAMLGAYSQRTAAMRLMVRGLSPAIARPLLVADRDQATSQARGSLIFAWLPFFLLTTAFIGGMFLAMDGTAGERERLSLEPLLINPVPRWQILAGKLGATVVFSFVSVCLAVMAFSVAVRFMPTGGRLGLTFEIGGHFAAVVLPLMLPLLALIATVQTLVSALSRSYREAQTYLGLVNLLPIIPALLSTQPIIPELWMYALPMVGQQFAMMQALRNEAITWPQGALSAVSTAVVALLAFLVTKRLYSSERLAISA